MASRVPESEIVKTMALPLPPRPRKGAIVYGTCASHRSPLGVRFESRGTGWALHWSFRADARAVKAVKARAINMTNLTIDELFRGCPYCDNKNFVFCECGSAVCWDGASNSVFCMICGTEGQLGEITNLDGGSGM